MTDPERPQTPESPAPRGSYRKGRQRQAEIVEAAMQIFARAGYQNASFAAVAEAVGLTLPGLLHHFPRKVDLLIAVLDERDRSARDLFPIEGTGWKETLAALVAIARHNETIPGVVRAFAVLSVESLTEGHPAAPWFERRTAEIRALIAAGFHRGLADGSLAPDSDPEALASEVMAIMDGLQEQWLRSAGAFDMSGIFASYVGRLVAERTA